MADEQATNIWTKLTAVGGFLAAVAGLGTLMLQCTTGSQESKLVQPPPPPATAHSPATPNISGSWYSPIGVSWQIIQHGDKFRFTAEGVSCTKSRFTSDGDGTITGNTLTSRYTSSIGSRGTCSGTITDGGIAAKCDDSICSIPPFSMFRQ